jgi:hypothetical protein
MWRPTFLAKISIKFGVLGAGSLLIVIKFDDRVIFNQWVDNKKSTIAANCHFLNLFGHHRLTIDISGKTSDMTIVNKNNEIISDTVFRIYNVSINQIELGEIFYLNSQYQHTNNGYTDLVIQSPSDINGFNGQIRFNFNSPVSDWLYQNEAIDTPGWIQKFRDAWPQTKQTLQRKIQNTFGIDIAGVLAIIYFPKYLYQLFRWRRMGGRVDGYEPILSDFYGTEAGNSSGGYFYQDIMVANHILNQKSNRHVTIGSNITGFVGHVATFMPITVCDIRPLGTISHHNIDFVQRDFGDPCADNSDLVSDSVSCLSCLHHVGIGRYGDPINPDAPFLVLDHLSQLVAPGGFLYLGTTVGPESRVIFNQSRVFTVQEILEHLPNFDLARFDYYNPVGNVIHENLSPEELLLIPEHSYGIFVMKSKAK